MLIDVPESEVTAGGLLVFEDIDITEYFTEPTTFVFIRKSNDIHTTFMQERNNIDYGVVYQMNFPS